MVEINKQFDSVLNSLEFTNIKSLLADQSKLLYQKQHLTNYLESLNSTIQNFSISVQVAVEVLFDVAVKNAFGDSIKHSIQINIPNKSSFGDYQCNSAMRLPKDVPELQSYSPKEVADIILSSLPKSKLIEKTELAGPGFINIWISKEIIMSELKKILIFGALPPRVPTSYSVIVDMSSPNIAKEMHVGHLRSTIIGESVARLLTFMGHRVTKLNHVGDWGTQFGMLIAHLREQFPDLTTLPPIADLQNLYKAAKQRFDNNENFKKSAYEAVVKLQKHDPVYTESWKQICDISRREFENIYQRLGIENLIERGESFYQSRMDDLVDDLKSQSLLQFDEGRYLLWPEGCEIPLTIVKSDGGYTYDTSDLAAMAQRLFEEKADCILYVVDSGQSVHFNVLLSAAQMLGFYRSSVHRIQHISFGVVLGEDKKKFKTRSGESVRLVDLLDEGLERSKARLLEKGREKELTEAEFEAAQRAVGYGCIKYADLSHNRTNDYVFSFDKMLDDKGNTAVYLLYSYTRIRSIIRTSGYSEEKLRQLAETEQIKFDHPTEWNLGKGLCRFPDVLLKVQSDFLLHSMCDYLYELSCLFTSFYDACYCIERDRTTGDIVTIHNHRLLLCEATARVMKCCFHILGLDTVEKM